MILDFAVNDGHISPNGRDKLGYSFTGGARRGFEQLVRLVAGRQAGCRGWLAGQQVLGGAGGCRAGWWAAAGWF